MLIASSQRWVPPIDVFVSQPNGPLGYVFGPALSKVRGLRADWRVDPVEVEQAIRTHFDL